ncbi:unknown [[Mannheimia] succiniciproducens MBEL55E]|uniref:Uncharacterized protein n=1 Tax=Mannheimia succiniciproducens (strain KCTC 0769BP / MBEL55E) TaxID=221988 RepID=Q65W67_MANSM|nr:unknown [[Mannheimia] succiniciproducens MBEL55E]
MQGFFVTKFNQIKYLHLDLSSIKFRIETYFGVFLL